MTDSSLLPYLGGFGGPFSIELSPDTPEVRPGSASGFPFEIITSAGAPARIIPARVTSDAGSTVKPLFLMLSTDDHTHLENARNPLTNTGIESIWKHAFDRHNRHGSLISLSSQDPRSLQLVSFRPLFYCTRTRLFFHPPCPDCGKDLVLCRDEGVLAESRLQPYSSSLRRYLFCPACREKDGRGTFYSIRPDAGEPENVKGPEALMKAFGKPASGDLPCVRCPEHASCHTRGEVLSCLVPVAFYPFFLLVLEAGSLNASDYLSLVSGARCEELEKILADRGLLSRSRMVSRFRADAADLTLFAEEERRFLEVLFLKLSFLDEAARYLLTGESGLPCNACGPSIEGMWLTLPEPGGLLPTLWGAGLTAVEWEVTAPEKAQLQGNGDVRQALGTLWFHALLENRTQDSQAVHAALGSMLNERRLDVGGSAFAAENIFWEPGPAPRRYAGYWEKALMLGFSLLTEGGSLGYPADEFSSMLRSLKREIRKELFGNASGEASVSSVGKEETNPDEQIGLALRQIMSRWKSPAAEAKEVHTVEPLSEEAAGQGISGGIEETAILPGTCQPVSGKVGGEAPETMILEQRREEVTEPATEEEDFTTETVHFGRVPDAAPAMESAPPDQTVVLGPGTVGETSAKKTAEQEQDIEATVVLETPRPAVREPVQAKPAPKDDDLMAATVIIGAESLAAPVSGRGEENPDETVILGNPGRKPPEPLQTKPAPKDEDPMTETVVTGPGHGSESAPETVILSAPGREAQETGQQGPARTDEDRMEATVIMNAPDRKPAPTQTNRQESKQKDAMAETVIMGGPAAPRPRQANPSVGDDDGLDETIIMTPDKKGGQP